MKGLQAAIELLEKKLEPAWGRARGDTGYGGDECSVYEYIASQEKDLTCWEDRALDAVVGTVLLARDSGKSVSRKALEAVATDAWRYATLTTADDGFYREDDEDDDEGAGADAGESDTRMLARYLRENRPALCAVVTWAIDTAHTLLRSDVDLLRVEATLLTVADQLRCERECASGGRCADYLEWATFVLVEEEIRRTEGENKPEGYEMIITFKKEVKRTIVP